MVFVQPLCAIACINICVHIENPESVCTLKTPNLGSHTTVWTHREILHTLVGKGSAALAAAVCLTRESNPNFPSGRMKFFVFFKLKNALHLVIIHLEINNLEHSNTIGNATLGEPVWPSW